MIYESMETLLACASEAICDHPVCREFINPGPDAPHDTCQTSKFGDGQLWVAHLDEQPGWPSPTGLPTTCATLWTEVIELGIVRCARGKVTDQGTAPPAEDVSYDAEIQQRDRHALRQAILCCWGVEGKDLVIQSWVPIPPAGGCVGGVWTVAIRDGGCDCGSMGS